MCVCVTMFVAVWYGILRPGLWVWPELACARHV